MNNTELDKRIKHEEAVLVKMVKDTTYSDEAILEEYRWLRELKEKRNLAKVLQRHTDET